MMHVRFSAFATIHTVPSLRLRSARDRPLIVDTFHGHYGWRVMLLYSAIVYWHVTGHEDLGLLANE